MKKAALAFFVAIIQSGCNNLNTIDFTASDNAAVQNESNSDAQAEETDDLTAVAVSADPATLTGRRESTGRSITIIDSRFQCAVVTIDPAVDNSLIRPHGTITIDFGTGCQGPAGKVRAGKIFIEYMGRRFLPGSRIITTFQDYSVNGKKIEGTRTLINTSSSETSAISFSILEDGMKITYPDGTTATRTSTRTRTWNRTTNSLDDSWTVSGSAVGTNRRGKEYTMNIIVPLVYKRSCAVNNSVFLPVKGKKELVTENKKLSLNFGDGACDNLVELSVNGKTKTIDISAD